MVVSGCSDLSLFAVGSPFRGSCAANHHGLMSSEDAERGELAFIAFTALATWTQCAGFLR